MPRPDVSVQRRAAILQAAAVIFARTGIGTARMEDIAAEAGLSKGTLYLYFDSKDALIEALLHQMFQPLTEALDLLSGPEPASARLTRYVAALLEVFERWQPLYALVFEAFALVPRNASAQALMSAYLRDYHSVLVQVLDSGVEAGEFRRQDMSPVATMLIALMDGLMQVAIVDADLADVRRQGAWALRFVLDAIAARHEGQGGQP